MDCTNHCSDSDDVSHEGSKQWSGVLWSAMVGSYSPELIVSVLSAFVHSTPFEFSFHNFKVHGTLSFPLIQEPEILLIMKGGSKYQRSSVSLFFLALCLSLIHLELN